MSKCSLYDLYDYMKAGKLPTIYGYSMYFVCISYSVDFPNSSFSQTVEIPLSQLYELMILFYLEMMIFLHFINHFL